MWYTLLPYDEPGKVYFIAENANYAFYIKNSTLKQEPLSLGSFNLQFALSLKLLLDIRRKEDQEKLLFSFTMC